VIDEDVKWMKVNGEGRQSRKHEPALEYNKSRKDNQRGQCVPLL